MYSEASKEWKSVRLPGSVTFCRAFGEWAAFVMAEGSTAERRKEAAGKTHEDVNPELGASIDAILDHTGRYFPGALDLYNASTARSYVLTTGVRDSEPLLIAGDILYFRVNDGLYRADLGALSSMDMSDATPVVSDPRILNVHWAFLSRPE